MLEHHPLAGLKAARLRSTATAEVLAERIGVTANTYYRYEAGSRRLYFDKACVLADAIGCSLDDLRRAPAAGEVVAAAALEGWDTAS